MHDYSIDTPIRRYVHVAIALASLSLPAAVTWASNLFLGSAGITFTISFGLTFALFYLLFDRFVWKWLEFIHNIPDLNGSWRAEGISSYEDPATGESSKFQMTVRIKQTFSRLEVFTETADSTSRSFMASLETNHAVLRFRYGFENTPKNVANIELQRHPGMMELRIPGPDKMEGDYFSGKHRLRYGQLTLHRELQ